ncbi:transcription initiation factor TFIIF subunit beta, partial [Lecanoromycetidae sp. Uapishka_2]
MTSTYGNGNVQEPRIKPDPESVGDSPAAQDDDVYEDAGDLDFSGAEPALYLTRIPKFLWEQWSKLDDNQEIQIGTVRVEGNLSDVKRMSLLLTPNLPQNQPVPKEYNMQITNPNTINTFIFTEKDLPGYRKYTHDRAPPRFRDRKRIEKPRAPGQQEINHFRRAIPKQTNLTGKVQTEINCLPVENPEYQQYMDKLSTKVDSTKPKLKIIQNEQAARELNPRNFGTFTTNDTTTKAKRQENKAIRMPQNELLDRIFEMYTGAITHIPLSRFKEDLNQPEAWLKETLDKIAVLVKGGNFNLTYTLKDGAKAGRNPETYNNATGEAGSMPNFGLDGAEDYEDDDDDDSVKMEDVL